MKMECAHAIMVFRDEVAKLNCVQAAAQEAESVIMTQAIAFAIQIGLAQTVQIVSA